MYSIDATCHAAQDRIYLLQNPAPASPLVKLVHGHKEVLKILAEIFIKANPPAVPPRMPFRKVVQKKLQEVNQKGRHNQSQSSMQKI